MEWNTEELEWIAAATVTAALVVLGGARVAAGIRFRRDRTLIADALERMCASVSEPAVRPRLRSMGRDVVEVLVSQDDTAQSLRAKAPFVEDSSTGSALLITADAVTTTVEPMRRERPDDSVWEESDVAPSVSEHPQLREITEQMGRSTSRLIAMGRRVLDEGERFGLPEGEAKGALAAALERAQEAVREAELMAESGRLLAALTALTELDVPVPESGFPGQAVADELRVQVNALARLGIRHREALAHFRDARIREERR
ncbi:hypothetical protein [Amycolatopsis sp. NPDC004169]|uniref:hypothetical protein n=1 Tax=Amycolatopsis sp. NPDC004169 TaxID=3154453 RepID=UPI0033B4E8F5